MMCKTINQWLVRGIVYLIDMFTDNQYSKNNSRKNRMKIARFQYEIDLESVKYNGLALKYASRQTSELCLEAVKNNGMALKYVIAQTPEICLEAVKQNPCALRYVRVQTTKICLEAIKQDGFFLKLVHKPTVEMYLEAIKQNSHLICEMNLKNLPSEVVYQLVETYYSKPLYCYNSKVNTEEIFYENCFPQIKDLKTINLIYNKTKSLTFRQEIEKNPNFNSSPLLEELIVKY